MHPIRISAVTFAFIASLAVSAHAACPADVDVGIMAARYANLLPAPNPPADLSMADALCGREKFTLYLEQQQGKVVGFKAGLTSRATTF